MTSLTELVPVLQMALGAVILISGIGLLLLTMTNRLGRIIDRSRVFVVDLCKSNEKSRKGIEAQLQILWLRARLIRFAIFLASMSALFASVLIIALFITAL